MHTCRCFKDGDAKSTLSVPVGNVMDTTKLVYEFSSSESKHLHNVIMIITIAPNFSSENEVDNKPQEVPFQVQIKYTSLDGQQCLRVFTEVRPVTSDKSVASKGS